MAEETPAPGAPRESSFSRWLMLLLELVGWGLLTEGSVALGSMAGGTLNSILSRTSWVSFNIALFCRLIPVGIAGAVFSRTQRAPSSFDRWKGVAVTVTIVAVVAVPWLVGVFTHATPTRP